MDQVNVWVETALANEYVALTIDWLWLQWRLHPVHIVIEALFVLILIYFFTQPVHKAHKPVAVDQPTKQEVQELLDDFQSEPFNSLSSQAGKDSTWQCGNERDPLTVHSYKDYSVFVQGGPHFKAVTRALNLATYDFFGLSTHPDVIESAKQCVRAYGVGSCGPRGFYGSVKPHIDLEVDLAKFLGTDNAIIYSFAAATTSTLIPCFSVRSDYLLVDNAVHSVVQQGVALSRSQAQYFRHNDLEHLEELMKVIAKKESKKSAKKLNRRAVVTEGLFRNTGDLANLPGILALCQKYKFRLYLDDSYGFGVLGNNGRGTPEHFHIETKHIDIYIGSLSTSLGAVGGFCAGSNMVVEHQRLAGTGYVFSASLPPYVTVAASKALSILQEERDRIVRLRRNSQLFRNSIKKLLPAGATMMPCQQDVSPIIHIRPSDSQLQKDFPQADSRFQRVMLELQRQRTIVLRSVYTSDDCSTIAPSLRIALKANMSQEEVVGAAKAVAGALKAEF